MAIRKNVTVFRNGSLEKVDLDENGRVVGKKTAAVKPAAPAAPKTKKELMAALKAINVKFNATLSAAALQELLDKATGATAPDPGSEDGDGDQGGEGSDQGDAQGGTGNQDVI